MQSCRAIKSTYLRNRTVLLVSIYGKLVWPICRANDASDHRTVPLQGGAGGREIRAFSPLPDYILLRWPSYEAPGGFRLNTSRRGRVCRFNCMLHLKMKIKLSTVVFAALLFAGLPLASSSAQIGISVAVAPPAI